MLLSWEVAQSLPSQHPTQRDTWWPMALESTLIISSLSFHRDVRQHTLALISEATVLSCAHRIVMLWASGQDGREGYQEHNQSASPLPSLSIEIIISEDQALYSTSSFMK